jgi:hypothetical protein
MPAVPLCIGHGDQGGDVVGVGGKRGFEMSIGRLSRATQYLHLAQSSQSFAVLRGLSEHAAVRALRVLQSVLALSGTGSV